MAESLQPQPPISHGSSARSASPRPGALPPDLPLDRSYQVLASMIGCSPRQAKYHCETYIDLGNNIAEAYARTRPDRLERLLRDVQTIGQNIPPQAHDAELALRSETADMDEGRAQFLYMQDKTDGNLELWIRAKTRELDVGAVELKALIAERERRREQAA